MPWGWSLAWWEHHVGRLRWLPLRLGLRGVGWGWALARRGCHVTRRHDLLNLTWGASLLRLRHGGWSLGHGGWSLGHGGRCLPKGRSHVHRGRALGWLAAWHAWVCLGRSHQRLGRRWLWRPTTDVGVHVRGRGWPSS